MTAINVTVYTQPNCQQCRATAHKLDQLRIPYSYIDVTAVESAAEHLKAEGWTSAPVVEVSRNSEVLASWSGYAPDMLMALATPGVDVAAIGKRGS